jgi:hypothetical protein
VKRLRKWTVVLLATAALVTIVVLATGSGAAIAAKVDSVFVTNTASNPVPVAQQEATKNTHGVLEYFNTGESRTFSSIRASLIDIQGDTFGSRVDVFLKSGGNIVLSLSLQPSERVVLPLPQLLTVDEIDLSSCFGSIQCFTTYNIVGS